MTTSITRIEQLFDAALDVPPDERAEWLDNNCAAFGNGQPFAHGVRTFGKPPGDGLPGLWDGWLVAPWSGRTDAQRVDVEIA